MKSLNKLLWNCVHDRICRSLCSEFVNSFARDQHLFDIVAITDWPWCEFSLVSTHLFLYFPRISSKSVQSSCKAKEIYSAREGRRDRQRRDRSRDEQGKKHYASSAAQAVEHKTVLDLKRWGMMPLPGLQINLHPRVTLIFNRALTPKVDRFMSLLHVPLVAIGIKIGTFIFKIYYTIRYI